jgi:hypothetical protein
MKWVLLAVAALAVLASLAALVGATLPLRHHATRKARFRVSPETLYAIIAGPPDWRADVKRFGNLPDKEGHRRWWEEDRHAKKITYELVEEVANRRRAVRIADRSLPFAGTWSFDIAPAPDGGSELRVSEDGEIYNVIFRFMARFVFGYTGSIEGYLRDLGTKLNQPVEIEA